MKSADGYLDEPIIELDPFDEFVGLNNSPVPTDGDGFRRREYISQLQSFVDLPDPFGYCHHGLETQRLLDLGKTHIVVAFVIVVRRDVDFNVEGQYLAYHISKAQNLIIGNADIEYLARYLCPIGFQDANKGAGNISDMHDRPPLASATEYKDLALLNGIKCHQVDDQIKAHAR